MARDKSLAAIKRQHTVRLLRLIFKSYWLTRTGRKLQMYDAVCTEFASLGGVYVKFLQGVLLNSKMFKAWEDPDKLKIFENLQTEPLDIVKVLRKELSPESLREIALVQPKPFAAGSFGQVYLGRHKNGNVIIIKALRPQMRALLKHDLRLISFFSRQFVRGHYKNMDVNINDALREFRDTTLRETDYVSEANFAHELYQGYKDNPKIIIPRTYMELCTKDLIVQDYIDGVSGVELLRKKEQGYDPKEYVFFKTGSDLDEQLTTLGVESLVGAFTLPRIQGDPHPGNVRFLPDNQIALIDFGIYAHAPRNKPAFFGVIDEWRQVLSEGKDISSLFEQFLRFFVNDLYKAMKKVSSIAPRPITMQNGENNLAKEVGKIVQGVVDSAIGKQELHDIVESGGTVKFFNNLVNKNNRFGLVVRFESSEILRAAQTYITLIESLGRRKYILENVFQEVVKRVEEELPYIRDMEDEPFTVTESLEIISGWLERVATRDPELFKQLINRVKQSAKGVSARGLEDPYA